MLWLVVIILLVVLLVASVPVWPYSQGWGYSPAGVLAAIAIVLLLLWMFGVIDFNSGGNGGPAIQASPRSGP